MKDQVSASTWDKMHWHGLGGEVLMETDFSGGNQTEHIYFNGQRMAKREPNGTVYFFFDDHLGNTRVATNGSGTVVDEFDPYPHGWFRTLSFTTGDWHLFTNHEYDPDTGLHYMQARHYSPAAGRFLQPDEFIGGPVELFAEIAAANPTFYADLVNPQSLNKYSYSYNNPLKYVDPDGHSGVDIANSIDAAVNNAVASIENKLIATGDPSAAAKGSFVVGVAADVAKGTADVLRLGEGTANAVDAANQGDYQGAAVEASADAGRVGAVILTVVGAASAVKGTAPAGEPPQLARGKAAHKAEPVRPGERAEVRPPSGRRMDRYDEKKAHIREIKPDHQRGQRAGQKQLDAYKQEMDKAKGRNHTTELTPYKKR